ncbi:39S ribosomal protein L42, mitochondrial [Eurytemora carolleeae]|uniref:39S ribosomal protein L42, mitochondrial n=1 Tax=Eurytemora carolleeae TaxID=1294199 RepID=UPI000C7581B3|nr:39S ribosomal protein L42, mitochondrial [Eurytemora carolleeae]|eukprot:XP_023335861.1 39S ribosomal protein L42, mitochondrial-like [Eurytemora affinis]
MFLAKFSPMSVNLPLRRLLSSSLITRAEKKDRYREEGICTNTTGDIICCWHPEPQFPYHLSQPIPRSNVVETDSKLNVQHVEQMKDLYHHKHERFQRRELMRLTWTTKHR